jgi:ribosomal protein S18 acetylase RimI-like enzyme
MTEHSVVVAKKEEIDRLILPIVLAFITDPIVRWLLPDTQQFMIYFSKLVRLHALTVVEHGGAYRTEDFRGAALWYPPNVYPDGPAIGAIFQDAMGKTEGEKIFSILSQMNGYKPQEPHWYLRMIGVDPKSQGNNYGSRLMNATLRECDTKNIPAYLEATSPRNRPLYEKLGFEVIGEIKAADSLTIWPMIRIPE